MTLQSSGAISLANIASEFGGSTPHSLSEYYSAASGIPSSGTISISQFYGKSANPSASGGSVYTTGGYRYHRFYSSGSFSVSNAQGATMQFVVCAGGGGGGKTYQGNGSGGGGGGGGGVSYHSGEGLHGGYVTVGGGGGLKSNGGNSSFSGCTSQGGGAGAQDYHNGWVGVNGGCGGGAGVHNYYANRSTSTQGNTGGATGYGYGGGRNAAGHPYYGGGGGGAGGAGGDAMNSVGGSPRYLSAFTVHNSGRYGSGGGAGITIYGNSGGNKSGGGYGGGTGNTSNGSANTGGGGGCARTGGSGMVIIRYPYA